MPVLSPVKILKNGEVVMDIFNDGYPGMRDSQVTVMRISGIPFN